jgi:MOSC domain-containing protein YiiM
VARPSTSLGTNGENNLVTGTLLGIARHGRPRGPMETVETVEVTVNEGVHGDFRGSLKPGRNKRQVTVMAAADWRAALAEVKQPVEWQERRVNLLVDGLALFETTGARLVFASGLTLEVTGECDPCSRMEEVSPGLKAALLPHWRGGVTTRVIEGGRLHVGDAVRIER